MARPTSRVLRWSLATFAVLLVVAAAAAAWLWSTYMRPLSMPVDRVEIRVAPGSTARAVAAQLQAAGLDIRTEAFLAAARAEGVTTSLRAGRYAIERGMSLQQILLKLRRGEVLREKLTVVEGWRFADLRAALAAHPEIRHDTTQLADAAIMAALGAKGVHPEGQFAPDTYVFDAGSSELDLLKQAHRAQSERLQQAWAARSPDLPYEKPYDALIMASIIEKETGLAEDRRKVAAVFVNRQRRGMLLQTDPTVIYGMGERFDGNLRKRDLLADGPYNTYTRAGLPPTPIALPGRAAILAALDPEASRALYFVSRGDGTSQFSESLAEHNRAVDRFQRGGAAR